MKNMDRGRPLLFQIKLQEYNYFYKLGLQAAIIELYKIKSNLDLKFLNKNYEHYNFLIIESSEPLPVVVSSVINPTQNFKGEILQDLSDLEARPEYLAFNAFSSNRKGFVVFSWLKKANIVDSFINSLLEIDIKDMSSYLINFFFSSAENTFISSDWWEDLDILQRNKIEELFNISSNPFKDNSENILIDNEVKFTGWNIENIYKV
ncbi:hypothetical protein [Psychrobacter sp. CAL346-MNA-CIBAN-0220]|uniref:hypothetical protein n=1 Tax=Psychrobacter sp. CAL346-MNA-CIBAN-0220 TaxID=3140457 RepID=UPI003325078D